MINFPWYGNIDMIGPASCLPMTSLVPGILDWRHDERAIPAVKAPSRQPLSVFKRHTLNQSNPENSAFDGYFFKSQKTYEEPIFAMALNFTSKNV